MAQLSARTRLDGAFTLWQRALDNYFDVDAFVIDLNSLVSTLRTVTWLVQKELRHRDGFEPWYAAWQERMKADPLMRWLVEARNHIEKQGDLDLNSTARVSLVADWIGAPPLEQAVPPLLRPEQIAAAFAASAPESVRRNSVLRVDRRWETASLPGHEILDACAHAYILLSAIVTDAEHEFALAENSTPPDRSPVPREMVHGFDSRTAYVHLETGRLLEYSRFQVERDDAMVKRAAERYGEPPPKPASKELRELARWHHAVGRSVLQADGHHITVAWLFRDGEAVGVSVIDPADQAEKYLLMESIARDVRTAGANQVVLTAEAWMATLLDSSNEEFLVRPSERKDRTEALVTHAADDSGQLLVLMTPFSQVDGKVSLSSVSEIEDADDFAMFPIRRLWSVSQKEPR